jgi:hypothetical protein
MELRPIPQGITVFGTRLTYRQAAFGAGVVLLILVLLITVVVKSVGDDKGVEPKPNAIPTTGGAATSPTSAATSATPSSAPPTTPPSSAPAAGPVPAGWQTYTQKASGKLPAFSIPVPNGANVSGGGDEIQFRWNNRLLIVARTGAPAADAYQDWKQQEADRRGRYRNYKRLNLAPVDYRDFASAADWEFTYTTDGGNPQHAVKRNIKVDNARAYSLSWYVSPEDWDPSQTDLQALYQGFQPK